MNLVFTAVLWLLASPVFLMKAVKQLVQRKRFWSAAYRATVECRVCGDEISLLGIWRCRCGFTYRGHVLRECPVCHSLPRMVRCYACGATEVLPEP